MVERKEVMDLIERLRTEEGRRVVKLGNSLSTRHAHREDVRAMLREAAAALEAVREAAEYMRNQVEWEPCDCGCPSARTPKDARAVTWLRAAAKVDRAISGQSL